MVRGSLTRWRFGLSFEHMSDTAGILLAAGMGKRFGARIPKGLVKVRGAPLFMHSLKVMHSIREISRIVLTVPRGFERDFKRHLKKFPRVEVISGGKERQDSVRAALEYLHCCDFVIIHDAARPNASRKLFKRVLKLGMKTGGAICGTKSTDTVKVAVNGKVQVTIPREHVYKIQTPQCFRFDWLVKAHSKAWMEKYVGTDDAELVELTGKSVCICEGEPENVKVTFRNDLKYVLE